MKRAKFLCILIPSFYIAFSNPPAAADTVRFVDVTSSSGVVFRHVHGGSGMKYFPETMGSGCAAFDYDNDGWLDLFAVTGGALPGYRGGRPLHGLYRNRGDGTFEDVTDRAGVGRTDYGMGCCAGDYDNDGFIDLYVTCYGRNSLFHSNRDGTFTDVARHAGVAGDSTWSTGCAFFDYNADGYLDLYVANYVVYALSDADRDLLPYAAGMDKKDQIEKRGDRAYPHPINFPSLSGHLYRNNGDGTFVDVTEAAGLSGKLGKGLGAISLDFDDDGDVDLYVNNDMTPNFLFKNQGGSFEEVGLFSGVGYNEVGGTQASMGVDAGDYDGDGRLDLVLTNFQDEGITLYRNDGNGFFTDLSMPSGLRIPSLDQLTWGVAFVDADNDGWPDVFAVGGHVLDNIDRFVYGASYPQKRLLLQNSGNGLFVDVSDEAGPGLEPKAVGRGAAFGDLDNDGDVDVFVNNNNGPASLLRNEGSPGSRRNHWLAVKLEGGMKVVLSPESRVLSQKPKGDKQARDSALRTQDSALSNRDGIGARVTVWAGGRGQVKEVRSGSSYLSQNDLRLHFGLGAKAGADSLEVRWPAGLVQKTRSVEADRLFVLQERAR